MSNPIYFEVYRKLSCSHCSVYSLDCLVAAIVHEKQWLFYTLCNRDREIAGATTQGKTYVHGRESPTQGTQDSHFHSVSDLLPGSSGKCSVLICVSVCICLIARSLKSIRRSDISFPCSMRIAL